MNHDRLYELISRKLAQQATEEELRELQEYFLKNPYDQYFDELITSYWDSQHETAQHETDSDEHFNHILQMADETPVTESKFIPFEGDSRAPNKKRWIRRITIAASFLLLAFSWWWFTPVKKVKPTDIRSIKQSEIVANKGTRSRIVLPDSSIVYLNADTKLNYPQQFSQDKREVYLDGEAFFNVKKNPNKPFIVHTSGIQVKVLGTTFNVKAYSTGKLIETSLITGSIEVTVNNRPNEKITLSPNAKLVIKNNGSGPANEKKNEKASPDFEINPIKPDPKDNTIVETQWMENRLVFRNETFDEVARMMERWYNVIIEIDDDELKSILLSGTFENETIEQALDALKYTKSFRYNTSGEKIKIYR